MAINTRNPIVTNGLVLNLDAANTKSYPRSGTNWFDLSGNNNSGSLVNGPTFSSANAGSIAFDGVDDYVQVSDSPTLRPNAFTIETCLDLTNSGSIFVKPYSAASDKTINFSFPWGAATQSFGLELYTSPYAYPYFRSAQTISTGNRYYVSLTYNGAVFGDYRDASYFVNGVYSVSSQANFASNGSYSVGSTLTYSNLPLNIARNNAYATPTLYLKSNIYFVRFYNRALSIQEVQQNYNAMKGRFGL